MAVLPLYAVTVTSNGGSVNVRPLVATVLLICSDPVLKGSTTWMVYVTTPSASVVVIVTPAGTSSSSTRVPPAFSVKQMSFVSLM